MKTEKEIRKVIELCEGYLLYDKDYTSEQGGIKGFPFYGEVNTGTTTMAGIRKILLWTLGEQPNNCRRLCDETTLEKELIEKLTEILKKED